MFKLFKTSVFICSKIGNNPKVFGFTVKKREKGRFRIGGKWA